jgi:hypothetical protein
LPKTLKKASTRFFYTPFAPLVIAGARKLAGAEEEFLGVDIGVLGLIFGG